MDKQKYIVLTPDPCDEVKSLVFELNEGQEVIDYIENCDPFETNGDTLTYHIKIVQRTKQWRDKIPEL